MGFSALNLSQNILVSLEQKGYKQPSPIQAKAIPAILEGRDVMAAAQTGTGKTAAFTLPMLQLLSKERKANGNKIRALVLTPTRELAIQVAESVTTYGANMPLRAAVVYGGVKINPQMIKLKKGVDILVATPGRLLDLFNQNAVNFSLLELLVLDEADRMLDMGFIRDIKKIIGLLPKKRQNLMFSAPLSDDIRALAKGLINKPIEISVSPRNTTVEKINQVIHPVDKKRKSALLSYLIGSNNWQQVLVFSKTKHGANRLTKHLEQDGIKALAIHGNKSQGARLKALNAFKANEISVLVATDIAARGIDINFLPHVVNFDLPNVSEDYVHRIGRTGRAGNKGEAVSLVSADEIKLLNDIERLIKTKIKREFVDGFEPIHDLPSSKGDFRPLKPKKPKKHKKANSRTDAKPITKNNRRPKRSNGARTTKNQRPSRNSKTSNKKH